MTKLKNNGKEKTQSSSIDTTSIATETTTSTWSHLNVLNQIMTPVQLLNDNSLQQELDFFTTTQFKFNETNGSAAITTPITAAASTVTTPIVANTSSSSYFDSLNIPSEQNHQEYRTNHYSNDDNYTSLLFHHQQQQQQQSTPSNDGSLLLTHEPRTFTQNAQQQPQQRTLQSLYSNNSTPANSTPNSPVINFDNHHQQNYFERHENNYNNHSDRFASMFLSSSASSSNNNHEANNNNNNNNKGTKNTQKFRFKQDTQPLDSLTLSKHNMEQDKRSGIKRSKGKKKAPATKVPKKKPTRKSESDDEGNDDEDEDDEVEGDDQDEDEPVIGDGALSYSSMGSNGSQPLTKDDKRRRNTAASARFRIKKKMREQALQNTACEMTDKAQRMEQRVHELEREIKWLKALVVEKSEVRIEQLVRERPPDSTAFPNNNIANFPSSSVPSSSLTSRNKNYLTMMNSKEDGEDDEETDDGDLGGRRDQDDYQYSHKNKNSRRY